MPDGSPERSEQAGSPPAPPPDANSPAAPAPGATKRRRRPLRRLLTLVLGTVVCGYVAVCLFLFLAQGRLIYFPEQRYGMTPKDVRLEYEEVTLAADDGVPLAAWYVPHPSPKATFLICHGNGGNMSDFCQTLKTLHRMGYSALVFDYRGYGGSTGKPDEQGFYRDAEAAWRYLVETRGQPPQRIVLLGRSLGAAVAIELASRHSPAALITECAFTSLVDIGRQEYPLLPVSLLCTERNESIRKVPRVGCPKLFFHGAADEIIPLTNGRRLFEAAAEPKRLVPTGGGHNTAGFEYDRASVELLRDWLDRLFAGE
jgi:fermentation-respiration switch protein FrsA (DUF1100 family)